MIQQIFDSQLKNKMDDDIYDMKIEESDTPVSKARITEKYYPGFACFFENYLKEASISFKQCYEKLLTTNHAIKVSTTPIKELLKIDNQPNPLVFKQNKLMERSTIGQQFIHFSESQEDPTKMSSTIIDYTNNQQDEIWKLERKLQQYKAIKQKLLRDKQEEFERVRREQQIREQQARAQMQAKKQQLNAQSKELKK